MSDRDSLLFPDTWGSLFRDKNWFSPYDSLESIVSNEVILVPLGEEIPLERGHQRGIPPLEIVILPLLAHLTPFPLVDCWIRSRDIRDQSPELSEI